MSRHLKKLILFFSALKNTAGKPDLVWKLRLKMNQPELIICTVWTVRLIGNTLPHFSSVSPELIYYNRGKQCFFKDRVCLFVNLQGMWLPCRGPYNVHRPWKRRKKWLKGVLESLQTSCYWLSCWDLLDMSHKCFIFILYPLAQQGPRRGLEIKLISSVSRGNKSADAANL